jgi:hypothetical protein
VELGAIIIVGRNPGKNGVPPRTGGHKTSSTSSPSTPVVCWDLLGESILRRTVSQLRDGGVQLISVLDNGAPPHNAATQAWERAVLDYARSGVEQILLLDLSAYSEVNIYELLRFHRENRAPVTNVADDRGLLGITVLAASALDHDGDISRRLPALSSCSSTFEFSGFVHRLATARDYHQLGQCVLAGMCNARPVAREIQPGVWIGEGARVHSSVRVLGPCFLGAKTRVKAGGVIASGTAIERECEIDCGTVVEAASILPRTYVAPGLRVSNAVVHGSRFVHLGRKLEVELGMTGLLGSTENRVSRRILDTLGSVFVFGGSGLDLPTPSRAPASLDYVRGNGFME